MAAAHDKGPGRLDARAARQIADRIAREIHQGPGPRRVRPVTTRLEARGARVDRPRPAVEKAGRVEPRRGDVAGHRVDQRAQPATNLNNEGKEQIMWSKQVQTAVKRGYAAKRGSV